MSPLPTPDATIRVARAAPNPAWDAYVGTHPAASVYHLSRWPGTVADLFKLEAYYLTSHDADGRLNGVLPLVRQRSRIFGDRLTSLPFFNYGGALADTEAVREALMNRAAALAQELGVGHLELRDTVAPPPGWSCRTDKVTLLFDLPPTCEALQKGFGSKLRSQIKRADRDRPELKVGGADRVPDFYQVFAEVMRDLGTPVYPRRFFEQLAEAMPGDCTVVTLHTAGRPVSGAFLVGYRDRLEIPWAGTVAAMKPRAINMVLYAEVLKLAVSRGFRTFDFGRSTVDTGPYRFKLQWGAKPVPLHWAIGPRDETGRAKGPENSSARAMAVELWSRLPLAITNRLGPLLSPNLPW